MNKRMNKRMKKLNNYYARTRKDLLSDVDLITQLLMQCDGEGVNEIMSEYFKPYWPEFKEFWAQCGEQLDWITFALAPHNSDRFIIYVFQEYPEVRDRVMKDYYGIEEK